MKHFQLIVEDYLYGIFRGCLLCGKKEINKLLCAVLGWLSYFLKRKQHPQDLHISITNIRHNFEGNFQQIAPLSTNVAEQL